jgi:cyclopropane fatty-acyl-phospholipid synthase-like methyltransferase
MPWEGGSRSELVELVRTGRLEPCRALDLGCGSGANAVFLAEHGFEATGVDFAASALDKADRLAKAAGVDVAWIKDDLTRLRRLGGEFDLLVDYGALDGLGNGKRDRYVEQVTPLLRTGGSFLLKAARRLGSEPARLRRRSRQRTATQCFVRRRRCL